ncbi:MAG: hypothetical protein LBD55_06960 [Treponema sp.]|jgi:hypothetical protein|nr:hypothetical protein [Treponema sp.]
MNHPLKTFLYRDLHAPFSTLAGAGFIVMSSSRLAFGLVAAAALLWVYNLTMAAVFFARPIYPAIGKKITLIFLTSLLGSGFLLLLWLASPLLAMEMAYIILLAPCYAAGSPLFSQLKSSEISPLLLKASAEAGSIGLLIIAFSLIREPIGFMALSLPGGVQGLIELFQYFEGDAFLPIKIIPSSAGALLLLGYGAALFRSIRKPGS